jgi:YD repeat-containing protein
VRICIIGKFPPIQGGVSMRTYWTAHALAARGHEVHVVTNAKEAQPPFRMLMRPEDWARCEAQYGTGSVKVHWTDRVDRSQNYIPMASPFVSKLAAIAAGVHADSPFDVIYSHYLEPYGVAAYLAAQITGVPHVGRMAGSDAGRLWHHPQFEALYDHVLRSAELVIAGGKVAQRAVQRGVAPERIAWGGSFVVPDDLFTPQGPVLDLAALRAEVEEDPDLGDVIWGDFAGERPYFGICGKLGESKGSFALLEAMHQLKRANLDIGLVALAHGQPTIERRFRGRARKLDLVARVLQIPFLPHWRVPEFLRGCLTVCCLEQDFPIAFHTPIIPLEVLLCGCCLVGSTEVIRKLPNYGRLVHGYGCVAIDDVNDVKAVAEKLAAIVRDPEPTRIVGARGRRFARELQQDNDFPRTLEDTLAAAAGRKRVPSTAAASTDRPALQSKESRFPLTQLAQSAVAEARQRSASGQVVAGESSMNMAQAREVLTAIERTVGSGHEDLEPLAAGVRVEVAIAEAEQAPAATGPEVHFDPLFRVRIRRWAIDETDLAQLVPVRDPRMRVIEFEYDVSDFRQAQTLADLPATITPRRSHIIAFGFCNGEERSPLVVDDTTAKILGLSDGTRTAGQIIREAYPEVGTPIPPEKFDWIESLFVNGLISLQDKTMDEGVSQNAVRRGGNAST